MNNDTKIEFGYIPGKRFIVEIRDTETGRFFYTKRIRIEKEAFDIRDDYNLSKSLSAKVCDTQSGEMF